MGSNVFLWWEFYRIAFRNLSHSERESDGVLVLSRLFRWKEQQNNGSGYLTRALSSLNAFLVWRLCRLFVFPSAPERRNKF